MRESLRQVLLREDPETGPVDMRTLVGIAAAIEHESVQRYAMLADAFERRGEAATAAAFRAMCDEERKHVDAVGRWAESLQEPVPSPETFEWLLPPDLSSSWDEVAGSALLTPYRAFSIAVVNEQRAFSFYTYLAAHATGERVRVEAERLAGEELRHAALMRKWRREAWHRARRETPPVTIDPIASMAELRERVAKSEATITRCQAAVAVRLREIGDNVSAQVVEEQLAMASRDAAASGGRAKSGDRAATTAGGHAQTAFADRTGPPAGQTDEPVDHAAAIAACTEALPLLIIAQKPLEALSERLEAVMAISEGELFDEAAQAMDRVVKRLARIGLRAVHLQTGAAAALRPRAASGRDG